MGKIALLLLFSLKAFGQEGTIDRTLGYDVIVAPDDTEYHTGLLPTTVEQIAKRTYKNFDCDATKLPAEFDLRTLGFVSETRNQASCGSCWAFSMTGSLESAMLVAGKGKLDLSEQELVSCDHSNGGCSGGNLNDFSYQVDHGQGLEKDYPYTARNGRCKSITVAAKGTGFEYIGAPDRSPTEAELKCGLYTAHTVPWIVVSASGSWSRPPKDEKTAYKNCGRGQTNHAVGVVGWWTDSKGKTQFIMKNSWGESWGDKGYMSLPLGCDSFGEEVAFIKAM